MLHAKVNQRITDRANIAARAEPLLSTAAKLIRDKTLAAFKRDEDIAPAVKSGFDTAKILFADAMTLAHIRAATRIYESVPRGTKRFSAYDDAIDYWRRRSELPEMDINKLRERYGTTNVDILKDAEQSVEDKAREAISDIVREGMHVKEGADYLDDALSNAGLQITSPSLLNTLVRTQIAIAYAVGQWQTDKEPEIQRELWGYEYKTVGDDRVRPEHAALEGVQLPKDDPRWLSIWPPNGFNCRCIALEVWNDENTAGRIIEVPQPYYENDKLIVPGPDKGWDVNHGELIAA